MSDILRSIFLFLGWFTPLFRYEKEVDSVFAYQEYQERFIHMLRKTWSLYVHEMKDSCHYAIMYSIQHTTSHHAYDIYTSTCMLACKKKLKCQHFSANCPDVLNVGSVPSAGCNLDIIPTDMKQTFGRAYELLFQVHASLRLPVNKCDLTEYQNVIDNRYPLGHAKEDM